MNYFRHSVALGRVPARTLLAALACAVLPKIVAAQIPAPPPPPSFPPGLLIPSGTVLSRDDTTGTAATQPRSVKSPRLLSFGRAAGRNQMPDHNTLPIAKKSRQENLRISPDFAAKSAGAYPNKGVTPS